MGVSPTAPRLAWLRNALRRPRGIRAWLAGTLLLVSVVTAGAVAAYVLPAAERQFEDVAGEAGIGAATSAAHEVAVARTPAGIRSALALASRRGQISLWLVGGGGAVLGRSALPSLALDELPGSADAVRRALGGRRYLPKPKADGSRTVGLPVVLRGGRRAALVAYVPGSGFSTRAAHALRRELLLGAGIAVLVALAVSLALAGLVSRRVRRLAAAAGRIAEGDFGTPVHPGRVGDEIGSLAQSIDEMRRRLSVAFASLQDERERLAVVVDRLEEGVVAVDRGGIVQLANPAAAALVGAPVERLAPLPDAWPAFDLPAFVRASAGQGARPEAEVRTPDGRVLRLQAAALGLDGTAGALVVLSDRTAERRREENERRFITNASHELRTPLAAIVAAVEVLQAGAKDDPAARETFLDDIQREGRRLERLTDTLLTLARLGTGDLRPELRVVALAPRARHAVELLGSLAQAAGVSTSVRGEGEAIADPDLLEQVLIGLVGNALKHTPRGGRVEVEIAGAPPRIAVRDTGSGIDPGDLAHVFDRFWRADASRRHGGFGLGLGICREFVAAMGGTLAVSSPAGGGTLVEIALRRPRSGTAAEGV